MCGNKHKFQQGKFQLDIRKNFHHGSDQTLEYVAQWDCEISILADIYDLTRKGLEQRSVTGTALNEGSGLDDVHQSDPIYTILWLKLWKLLLFVKDWCCFEHKG